MDKDLGLRDFEGPQRRPIIVSERNDPDRRHYGLAAVHVARANAVGTKRGCALGYLGSRATNGSNSRKSRGRGCATPMNGFEIDDGGVPAKVEDVVAEAAVAGAAALLS